MSGSRSHRDSPARTPMVGGPAKPASDKAVGDNSLMGEVCADQNSLSAGELSGLEGLKEQFGIGLGAGDLKSAVDIADNDLPPALAAAAAGEVRAVAGDIAERIGDATTMLKSSSALVDQVDDCGSDIKSEQKLITEVSGQSTKLETAFANARNALAASFRLSPESDKLVGNEGDLAKSVIAGGETMAGAAHWARMVRDGFYNGRKDDAESAAEAGARVAGTIDADVLHYTFRFVLQNLDEDRRDLEMMKGALESRGLSTADFPADISGWYGIVMAEDFEGNELGDWAAAVRCVDTISGRFEQIRESEGQESNKAPFNPFTERMHLPSNVKVAEHIEPVAAMVRFHNHMFDHFEALTAIHNSKETAADESVYSDLINSLQSADSEWAGSQALVLAMVDRKLTEEELVSFGDARPGANSGGQMLKQRALHAFTMREADTLIELRARGVISSESITDPGDDALARQAVEAAGYVDKLTKQAEDSINGLTKSVFKAQGIDQANKVLSFYGNAKGLQGAPDIMKAAVEAKLLTSKDIVDVTASVHGVISTCAGAVEKVLGSGSEFLETYSGLQFDSVSKLEDMGEIELAKFRGTEAARRANSFHKVGAQLGKVGAIGDFLGAAKAGMTLLDPNASNNDKRGATFDLASAGVGIGSSIASAAGVAGVGTVGTAAGLGIAYVKMISDELAAIKAMEASARANLRGDAWRQIHSQANQTLQATARAAASSQLFRNEKDAANNTTEGKGYERYKSHIDNALRQQNTLLSTVRGIPDMLEDGGSLRFVPDTVGWKEDSTRAVKAFESNWGMGKAALDAANAAADIDTMDAMLGKGGLGLMQGATAAGQVLFKQGEADKKAR